MGNTLSLRAPRHCGLCYFRLEKDTPFLQEPTVSRRALPIYPTPPWTEGGLDAEFPTPKDVGTIQLKTKFQAIHDSSSRGCAGCAAILRCLESQLNGKSFVADQISLQEQCQLSWLVGDREVFHPSLQLVLLVKTPKDGYKKREFAITIFHVGDKAPQPASRNANRSFAESYTGSSASLKVLKYWLKECDELHEMCKAAPSPLPYRVLELQRDSHGKISVVLIQSRGGKEPYVCLSHRWGASTLRCRTVKDTLATHLQSVPWNDLPKTFQQACAVTLDLGLKYIWIDSLCIIQDDKEDWKVQAAQMCSIYQGSYVTIAATSASDSDQGLFREVAKFPIRKNGADSQNVFLRASPNHYMDTAGEQDDIPLLSRGWVYQERLLSSRVVHFLHSELRFEDARPVAVCECGEEIAWTRKNNHHRSLISSDLAEVQAHWREIIGQFSSLSLTYHSDCLPALAGIARQYGTTHQDLLGQYVAGLWEKTLLNDLLWYIVDGYSSKRHEVCHAPTWSWASTVGESVVLLYNQASQALEVVDFHINLAGSDEYGPVESARLTVRGQLVAGRWKRVVDGDAKGYIHFSAQSESELFYMHSDYDFSIPGNSRYIPEDSTLFCLKTGFVGDGCHVCLILRSIDLEKRLYERVGALINTPKDAVDRWYRECAAPESLHLE